jgi:predicted ATPase
MADINYWLIHPGKKDKIAQKMHSEGVIAMGWSEIGDMKSLITFNDIKMALGQTEGNLRSRTAGQLHSFRNRIRRGDIVVVPVKSQNRVWVAEVDGDYKYSPDIVGSSYPHTRHVNWQTEADYAQMGTNLISSAQSPTPLIRLKADRIGEVKQLLAMEQKTSTAYQFPEEGLRKIIFNDFKAFQKCEIDLRPITIISGINSSGKTTILQGVLLAKQTLITEYQSSEEDALVYDGRWVTFADFKEIIFGKPRNYKKSTHLGFGIEVEVDPSTIRKYFKDIPDASDAASILVVLDVELKYNSSKKVVVASKMSLQSLVECGDGDFEGPEIAIEPYGGRWHVELHWDGDRMATRDELIINRFIPVDWKILGRPRNEKSSRRDIHKIFHDVFSKAMGILEKELETRVVYVGPQRSGPQRLYGRKRVTGLDVGISGESAVQLLHENWNRKVDFVKLPDTLENLRPAELIPSSMNLSKAVSQAMRLLGIDQELQTSKLSNAAYEATLSLLMKPKTHVSIADVGFGVSQVLPILAVGLLSPKNSILIFEQPEIHLHPKAQVQLGEFFLCLARTGRRILLETHSEHLINRIRRRVVEDKTESMDDWASVLFVYPPKNVETGAEIKTATIDNSGEIFEWPKDFLAEGAKDMKAIIQARAMKAKS